MGSVKDLQIIQQAHENATGIGRFSFSDRYSVFDWGEMPDLIAGKGAALCLIGAFFFEKLEQMGMPTHYLGIVEDNTVKKLSQINSPADTMEVKLVRVIKPPIRDGKYDYSMYSPHQKNMLIPLEVIYRNSLPAGSSVFRRLKNGSLKLSEIGLETMPAENDTLTRPIFDVSTKLEVTDRYMNWDEAQRISGISAEEIESIRKATQTINELISKAASACGMINEDGKVEFAFDEQRQLMLVDILGTPDECRFTYQGLAVSKEVARSYYRDSDWYVDVEDAKTRDRSRWKDLVKTPPPALPPRFLELLSHMYQAVCNEITGRQWFAVPQLQTILSDIQEQIV